MDRRLLVLAMGMFALGTDSYIVAGVLPQMARAFDVGVGAAGQLTTVYAVTFALLAPTIAAVAAGVPRKLMMLSGLAVFVLANLGTALAPTFAIALLSRAVAGLGAAMFSPTATGSAASIVAPERRGHALSIVIAGMSAATALGSPAGAVIGGLGDWRWTMVFVAALAVIAFVGVWTLLSDIPLPPKTSLPKRLAPLADTRVGLTLSTWLFATVGAFAAYTYFAVVFDRAIGGNSLVLGLLLVLWGVAGTSANLLAGRLLNTLGARKIMILGLLVLMVDFALMPWSSAHLWSAVPAMFVWGACAWGMLVPQQHRLVALAPSIAPILLGLNTASTYLGMTGSAVLGAIGIKVVGAHGLGLVAVIPLVAALVASELAVRRINAVDRAATDGALQGRPA